MKNKYLLVFLIFVVVVGAYWVMNPEIMGQANCTAAKFHEEGKLVKIHLTFAPDYANRNDFERLLIQWACKLK
jgi:hypothetical protein